MSGVPSSPSKFQVYFDSVYQRIDNVVYAFVSYLGIPKLIHRFNSIPDVRISATKITIFCISGIAIYSLHKYYNSDEQDDPRLRRQKCRVDTDHCPLKPYKNTTVDWKYMACPSGDILYSAVMKPTTMPIKAIIIYLHGYASSLSGGEYEQMGILASQGYGVIGVEYPGHGRSDGIIAYIPVWSQLIDNVIAVVKTLRKEHFGDDNSNRHNNNNNTNNRNNNINNINNKNQRSNSDESSLNSFYNSENNRLKTFLMGTSMGGAVALSFAMKYAANPRSALSYDGLMLLSPMCKISDDRRPHPILENLLRVVAFLLPVWPITPSSDWGDMATHDYEYQKWLSHSPLFYSRAPRLGTALQLLGVTKKIETELDSFTAPMLILHGEADVVTDPNHSVLLFETANSKDKTLILYDNGYHKILNDFTKDQCYKDIFAWLEQRCDDKKLKQLKTTKTNENSHGRRVRVNIQVD